MGAAVRCFFTRSSRTACLPCRRSRGPPGSCGRRWRRRPSCPASTVRPSATTTAVATVGSGSGGAGAAAPASLSRSLPPANASMVPSTAANALVAPLPRLHRIVGGREGRHRRRLSIDDGQRLRVNLFSGVYATTVPARRMRAAGSAAATASKSTLSPSPSLWFVAAAARWGRRRPCVVSPSPSCVVGARRGTPHVAAEPVGREAVRPGDSITATATAAAAADPRRARPSGRDRVSCGGDRRRRLNRLATAATPITARRNRYPAAGGHVAIAADCAGLCCCRDGEHRRWLGAELRQARATLAAPVTLASPVPSRRRVTAARLPVAAADSTFRRRCNNCDRHCRAVADCGRRGGDAGGSAISAYSPPQSGDE